MANKVRVSKEYWQRILMHVFWLHTRRKKKKQQSMGSALSILRNLKFGSKGLFRSIKSSRHLANSNPSLRKREGRTLQWIIDSCPIVDPTTVSNKFNDSTGFLWLESCIYVVPHLG